MEQSRYTSGSETPSNQNAAEVNPLQEARDIAAENALLESEIAAPGGTRERRLRNRQRSYGLGCYYYAHPDEFQEFAALPYFDGMHKKPHLTNIMWSVMNHSMQAKGDAPTLQRVSKWGIVFEEFYSEGILPEDSITVLKDRGGLDYIYEQICELKKAQRRQLTDFEAHASDAPSIQLNPNLPSASPGDQSDEATESGTLTLQDRYPQGRAESRRTAADISDDISGQLKTEPPPKRCPLHRAAEFNHVAVRVAPWEVAPALETKRVIFFADVIQPDKAGGPIDVVARRVVFLGDDDEPWPDLIDPRTRKRNESPDAQTQSDHGNNGMGLPQSPRSTPDLATPHVGPAFGLVKRTSSTTAIAAPKSEVPYNPTAAPTERPQGPTTIKQPPRFGIVEVKRSRITTEIVIQEPPRRAIAPRTEPRPPRKRK